MKTLSKLRELVTENPAQFALLFVLTIFVVVFSLVAFVETVELCVSKLLGLLRKDNSQKFEILKFLGISMGGILLAMQALASHKRAQAMVDAAKAQAGSAEAQAEATRATEQGQRQERFKNAIEHLGDGYTPVRIGGAYELFHLAEDEEDQKRRQAFLDILCTHIRWQTNRDSYREKNKQKPSEEIQSLFTLLFVQEHDVFNGLSVNLQGSYLSGVDATDARLPKANLKDTHLQGAVFLEAHLEGARLDGASTQGVKCDPAYMKGAEMRGAHLEKAVLLHSQLQGTKLTWAYLQAAYLGGAQLQGADLRSAQLQGVVLHGTKMHGVNNSEARTFEERIFESKEKVNNLSGIIFGGGLSQDDVDNLAQGILDEREANNFRNELKMHVGIPASYLLPNDHGVETGSYTKEQARKWIAEYEEATSGLPKVP